MGCSGLQARGWPYLTVFGGVTGYTFTVEMKSFPVYQQPQKMQWGMLKPSGSNLKKVQVLYGNPLKLCRGPSASECGDQLATDHFTRKLIG